MATGQGDWSRLPQWAQRDHATLERLNVELREQIRKLQKEAGFTSADDAHVSMHTLRPIDPHATVRFVFDNTGGTYVTVRNTGKVLEIMASRYLLVQPQSGNVVRIYPSDNFI